MEGPLTLGAEGGQGFDKNIWVSFAFGLQIQRDPSSHAIDLFERNLLRSHPMEN